MAKLTKEEKSELLQLRTAQDAEIIAYKDSLRDAGYSNKEIRSLIAAERADNKIERTNAKTTFGAEGTQSLLGENQNIVLSNAATIIDPVRESFNNTINTALSYYDAYNIPGVSRSGNGTVGVSLDKLVKSALNYDPTTQQFTGTTGVDFLLNNAQKYVGNTFTEDDLKNAGVNVRAMADQDNIFKWAYGDGETKQYIYFNKNDDGTFTGIGANRTYTDLPGGFFNTDAGKFALIAASFFAPGIGESLYGLTGAAGAAAGGATVAGGATALQGGDIEDIAKSAAMGGITGYAGSVAGDYLKDIIPQDLLGTGGTIPTTEPVVPTTPTVDLPPIDLFADTTFPGQGLQVPTIPAGADTSYSLLDTGVDLTGQGLTMPTVPSIPDMGGAGGLEVGVPGGTVTQAGFTPTGATSAIGDPNSFINNPSVIGEPVVGVTPSTGGGLTVTDALKGVSLVSQLFGNRPTPMVQMPQFQQPDYSGIDFNSLLALLSQRAKRADIASLLG